MCLICPHMNKMDTGELLTEGGVDWREVQSEVIQKGRRGKSDWRAISHLILLWEKNHPSLAGSRNGMSSWLEDLAEGLGLQISNFWRYRKAFESAVIIWSTGENKVLKPLDIPEHVSAESIELLEKISRAAPSDLVNEVANRLYNNDVTRSELRNIWKNFRHAVEDKTSLAPRYSSLPNNDARRRGRLLEELVFEALVKDGREEGSLPFGKNAHFFMHVPIRNEKKIFVVDIVAVSIGKNGEAEYHGIDVCMGKHFRVSEFERIENYTSYFDYFWIIGLDFSTSDWELLKGSGFLSYSSEGLSCVLEANRNRNANLESIVRQVVPFLLRR